MFKVEKDVPVPSCGQGSPIYPWAEMEAGDSFFVPDGPDGKLRSVQGAGWDYCSRYRPDLKCKSRVEEGGIRIWLVKRES